MVAIRQGDEWGTCQNPGYRGCGVPCSGPSPRKDAGDRRSRLRHYPSSASFVSRFPLLCVLLCTCSYTLTFRSPVPFSLISSYLFLFPTIDPPLPSTSHPTFSSSSEVGTVDLQYKSLVRRVLRRKLGKTFEQRWGFLGWSQAALRSHLILEETGGIEDECTLAVFFHVVVGVIRRSCSSGLLMPKSSGWTWLTKLSQAPAMQRLRCDAECPWPGATTSKSSLTTMCRPS